MLSLCLRGRLDFGVSFERFPLLPWVAMFGNHYCDALCSLASPDSSHRSASETLLQIDKADAAGSLLHGGGVG